MKMSTYILNKAVRVAIPKVIIDRSDWVKYLIVLEWQRRLIDEKAFAAVTSERFNKFLNEQVCAYVLDKKAPPKEIAPAIMNLADDLLSGREPTLRTGDYIQLQKHMREGA